MVDMFLTLKMMTSVVGLEYKTETSNRHLPVNSEHFVKRIDYEDVAEELRTESSNMIERP